MFSIFKKKDFNKVIDKANKKDNIKLAKMLYKSFVYKTKLGYKEVKIGSIESWFDDDKIYDISEMFNNGRLDEEYIIKYLNNKNIDAEFIYEPFCKHVMTISMKPMKKEIK